MAYQNLLDLQINKVSTNISDYSLLIVGRSGIGKSPLLAELYGDRAIMLSFDNSQKGIAGIYSVTIDSYDTLVYYINQLQNPSVREKFDVVIIDTLSMFDYMCEKSVLDAYGKDLLSDCLGYNKAYKIVDKRFMDAIKKIQRMNYTMAYVCHPKEVKIKLQDGTEMVRIEPKVSDRLKDMLIPEIDVRLFATFNENGERVIYTKGNQYFDARCRVGDMKEAIPFDAKTLRKEFAEGVQRKVDGNLLADSDEIVKNVAHKQERSLEEAIEEIKSLGSKLSELGHETTATQLMFEELGLDNEGNQRTLADATEKMLPSLETIIVKLKELYDRVHS